MSPSSTSRIAALAATIQEQTALLDKYHADNNIPSPSFDEARWKRPEYPEHIQDVIMNIADATSELQELVEGPQMMIINQGFPLESFYKLITECDIPAKVPPNGSISYAELAKQTGINETALTHLLRYAITCRIFKEDQEGFLSHSAASRYLLEDENMMGYVRCSREDIHVAQRYYVQALQKWPAANDPGETGYMLAHNVREKTFYFDIAKSPRRVDNFAKTMKVLTATDGFSPRHLTDNYPWSSLPAGAQVVDLGGSTGFFAFAIAAKFPQLEVVVQDIPDTIAQAQTKEGVKVSFMVHDFFTSQPIHGADVYMIRWCLHNYPDEHAVRILQALVPALKSGARVLLMETVLPPLGRLRNLEDRNHRAADTSMAAIANSRERELGEWKSLFARADERFVLQNVIEPKGSRLALLELVWEP